MAKHLEVSLYRNARSFEAYMDMSTLKQRLQQIALEVSKRVRNPNENSSRDERSRGDQSISSTYSNSPQPPNGMRGSSPYMTSRDGGNGRMMEQDMNPMSNSTGGSSRGYQRRERMNQQAPPQQRTSGQNRNDPEWKLRIRHKQQRLLLLHHSAKCNKKGPCDVTPHCADMKRLWRHMEGCKDNDCRVSHCFSSRAILSHYRKCKDVSCPACSPVRETVRKSQSRSQSSGLMKPVQMSAPSNDGMSSLGANSFASSHSGMPPPGSSSSDLQYSSTSQFPPGSSGPSVQPLYRTEQNSDGRVPTPSSGSSSLKDSISATTLPNATRPAGSTESEWLKIRHKQQRLLLLRHASRCQHEVGKCPVTPHCASMKRLWDHIAHCKNQQCKVQHCLSSRYVLSHYRRCKNPICPSCGPVRDSIQRSNQREKSRQQQQQQPQSASRPIQRSADAFGSDSFQGPSDPIATTGSSSESLQPKTKRTKVEDATSVASSTVTAPMSNQTTMQKSSASHPQKVKSDDTKKPSHGDHSLLNSFSVKQLETHLTSLDRKAQLPPAKFKTKCSEILKVLQGHQHGWVFNCPVDPVELGLPDYFEIIKKPMDLGTIQKRLDSGSYHDFKNFCADVNLTFDNAMTYNEEGTVVYGMAKELKTKFESDMRKLMVQLEEEDMQRRQNERACTLCGCEKLLFEPPVYFCNGMNCQSQRIRRNSHFYIGGTNQYFWCSPCYNELDEKIPIELVDMTVMKGDLKKKKNDEVHEESWVQCDTCERWVHQICGLFNTRQNKEHQSEYCCPGCLCEKRKKNGDIPSHKPPGAAALPRTTLSEWLEQHIQKRIERKKRSLAEEKAESEVCFWERPHFVYASGTFSLTLSFAEYLSRGSYEAGRVWRSDHYSSGDFDGTQARGAGAHEETVRTQELPGRISVPVQVHRCLPAVGWCGCGPLCPLCLRAWRE